MTYMKFRLSEVSRIHVGTPAMEPHDSILLNMVVYTSPVRNLSGNKRVELYNRHCVDRLCDAANDVAVVVISLDKAETSS